MEAIEAKGRLKYYFRYFFGIWGLAVVARKNFSGSYILAIPNATIAEEHK
jgi:hypothetical protein